MSPDNPSHIGRPVVAAKPAPRLIVATPEYPPRDQHERSVQTGWLESRGEQHIVVGYQQRLRPLNALFRWLNQEWPLAITVAVRSRRIHELHAILAHNEATGLPLAILKRLGFLKCKLFIYNHAPLSDGPLNVKRLVTRFSAWDMMICLSEEECEQFRQKYPSLTNVTVNPLPINTDLFHPSESATARSSPYIFTCGVSHRDYETLVSAMRLLDNGVKCIIDPTSPWDRLKSRYFSDSTLPTNIVLASYPNAQQLASVVNQSTFVVLSINRDSPQLSAGCTLAAIAGASGKAVVAATSGLREYVRDGETGILVQPGDPHELARAIRTLWENSRDADSMGRRGRQLMVEQFSRAAWVRRFHEIVDGRLNTSTGHADVDGRPET